MVFNNTFSKIIPKYDYGATYPQNYAQSESYQVNGNFGNSYQEEQRYQDYQNRYIEVDQNNIPYDVPYVDYSNRNGLVDRNPLFVHKWDQPRDVDYNVGCNYNQVGAGYYRDKRVLYICTTNPNDPGPKQYEEIVLDNTLTINRNLSEDLIQTLINYLKVSGIGDIDRYVDYNELLRDKITNPNNVTSMIDGGMPIGIAKTDVTLVSEEVEYNDPIFGIYGHVDNDDQYSYSPIKYQFYSNFGKDLYVLTKDRMYVPIAKKLFNSNPAGLKEYVCIIKTYDLNPKYLDLATISKTIEHLAYNVTNVKFVNNERELDKLRDICTKNAIGYKFNRDEPLKPVRIRIITYIPEDELKANGYRLYIKSLGITISDKVLNLSQLDEIEHPSPEDKFVSSIKVLTDSSDSNDYYYRLNDKIITLPKIIDNTKFSKIVIEEKNGKKSKTIEVSLDDAKEHEIYTDKEEVKSIISSNNNKVKELENKQKELGVKEKELHIKEKELGVKEKELHIKEKKITTRSISDGIESFVKSAGSIISLASAGIGLGLAGWKLYKAVKG